MTDLDSMEQRLRRTFRVVAEQPIAPVGIEDEPWRNSVLPARRGRHLRRGVGVLATIVVVALVALGVAYGPRSSTPGAPAPVTQSAQVLHAVFAPASPQPRAVLLQAASIMRARLHALGDSDASVTTNNGGIEVSGRTLNPTDLRLVGETGAFYIRPVLCGAPAYSPPVQGGSPSPGPLPTCQSQYALTAANLGVNTSTQHSYRSNVILADPSFASYATTSSNTDDPSTTVLLPGDPLAGAQQYARFVLGPAELTGSDIATAVAQHDRAISEWIIDVTVKPGARAQWDAIAKQSFHAYIGFDLNGQVLSAPLIQPAETAFSSFRGQLQISGNFTGAEAKDVAAVLGSGPMPVRLNLQSLTHSH